jgi:uncharacterized membrane protein required for colicin V production
MFWLDTTILAVLAVGALLGAMSGFLGQFTRLVGVGTAIYAAVFFNDWAAQALQEAFLNEADPRIGRGLAYVIVFMVVYLFFFYSTRLLRDGVEAANLQAFDRLLGAGFGVGKMALLLAIVFFGMASYPHPTTQALLEKSALAPALGGSMEYVLMIVPEDYRSDLAQGLKNLRELGQPRPEPTPESVPAIQPEEKTPLREPPAFRRPGWGWQHRPPDGQRG